MTNNRFRIIVVEDNEADVFLLRIALEEARLPCELQVCSDGPEVLRLYKALRIYKQGDARVIDGSLEYPYG